MKYFAIVLALVFLVACHRKPLSPEEIKAINNACVNNGGTKSSTEHDDETYGYFVIYHCKDGMSKVFN